MQDISYVIPMKGVCDPHRLRTTALAILESPRTDVSGFLRNTGNMGNNARVE